MSTRIGYCMAVLMAVSFFAACAGTAAAQEAPDEAALIGVLKSDAGWQEKDAATRALRQKGTAASVPALAALLTNKELSHSARYALEPMPYPEAGLALRDALGKTDGLLKAGMAISLGVRRDPEAVPMLVPLIKDADADIARAALGALGRIANEPAVEALMDLGIRSELLRGAWAEALLTAGEILAKEGKREQAIRIYQVLQSRKWPIHVRMGAFRGLACTQPDKAPALLMGAMKGKDPAFRDMAAQLVAEYPDNGLVHEFFEGLNTLPPAGQVALLRGLAGRADKTAGPAVAGLLAASNQEVRQAAVKALASLGSGKDAAALADLLLSDNAELSKAAYATLVALKGDDVNPAIAAAQASGPAARRALLLDILADRRAEQTLALAFQGLSESELPLRIAALRALAPLGGSDQVPLILSNLANASETSERAAIEKALIGIAARSGEALLPAILGAMNSASVESRLVLLRVAAKMGGSKALETVCAATNDVQAAIAEEAVRVLAEWPTLDAAPFLIELAKSDDLSRHVLGIRGYVRLAGIEPAPEVKSKMLLDVMDLARRPDEQKIVLGGWGGIPTLQALDVLTPYLADANVRNESAVAITAVAGQLGKDAANKPRAVEALKAVIEKCEDGGIRERAQKALNNLP